MKNIHILPTDKPSKLYLGDNGNFVFGLIQSSIKSKNNNFINQNIYITSDEEIKEGCYIIKNSQVFKVGSNNAYSGTFNITLKYAKKQKIKNLQNEK